MSLELPPQRKIFLKVWIVALVVIYLALGVLAVATVENEKRTASRNHALRMDATAVEPGKTPPDSVPVPPTEAPPGIRHRQLAKFHTTTPDPRGCLLFPLQLTA